MTTLDEIQKQIHGEISSLQENLQSLKKIKDELEEAKQLVKEHITKIDEYIRSIQTHSNSLLNLFSKYADEIRDHTIREISRAISVLEGVGDDIIKKVNFLKQEITNLLKLNGELVQEAKKLFKQIDDINLPKRFDDIDNNIEQIKNTIFQFEKEVDIKLGEINNTIFQLGKQVDIKLGEINNAISQFEKQVGIRLGEINTTLFQFEKRVDIKLGGIKTEIDVLHKSNLELKTQNKILIYFSIGIATISLITLIYLILKG